jgi:general secretion pathway protein G
MWKKTSLITLSLAGFVLITAAIFLPCYVTSPQETRTRILQQELFAMRQVLDQYTLDHQRYPQSLDDLVGAGYLRQMPVDPMTGRSDTWVWEWSGDPKAPGIIGIHSGHR